MRTTLRRTIGASQTRSRIALLDGLSGGGYGRGMTSPRGKTRDVVAAELEGEILSGGLGPGDRLLSERQLAERHAVSRPIVREALRILAERGLVEISPGRGAFVQRPSALAGTRPLDALYRRGHPTARQLSEARLLLECETASLAAQRAGLDDVRMLRTCLASLEAGGGPEQTVRSDLAFHLGVAAAAHNWVIEAVLGSLASLTAELMVRSLADPDVYRRSAPYHRLVYEAIAARDPVGAGAAMRDHLSVASSTYGRDYDEDLDVMARRALRRLDIDGSLPAFVRAVIPAQAGYGLQ